MNNFDNLDNLVFDEGQFSNIDVKPNGSLEIMGTIATTGSLYYLNPDGSRSEEIVTKSVLFEDEHLSSIRGATLTLNHPYSNNTKVFVSPANYLNYTVGCAGTEIIKKESGELRVPIIISEKKAIDSVLSKQTTALSMAYKRDIHIGLDGKVYQSNRRCNHIALVKIPRSQGSRLLFDSADDVENSDIYFINDRFRNTFDFRIIKIVL